MTTRKKTDAGKAKGGKLKLKKETVKDLDPKRKGVGVRGGRTPQSILSCACGSDMCTKLIFC